MTRARQSLTLTRAVYRASFGNEQQLRASLPSRFLPKFQASSWKLVRDQWRKLVRLALRARPGYSYSPENFCAVCAANRSKPRRLLAGPRLKVPSGAPLRSAGADANPMLGRKVRHPSFGIGTIVGVEGDDEDRRVSVSFPGDAARKVYRAVRPRLEQA